MSENLNWIDRLRQSFENFEPKVEGNWNAMQKRLDVSGYSASELDMVRRVKAARRFAYGASVVAAGLALWMVIPEVAEQELLGTELESSLVEARERENGIISEDAEASAQKVHDAISDVHPSNYHSEGLPLKLDPALIERSYDAGVVQLDPDVTARTTTTFILNLPEMTVHAQAPVEMKEEFTVADVEVNKRNEEGSRAEGDRISATGSLEVESEKGAESANSASAKSNLEMSAAEEAGFNISVQEACAGTEVSFALNGMDERASVLWNFGDGGFSQQESPSHIYENAGTYDITVSVRAPGDGTIRTRSVENMIVVRPKPDAEMSWAFEESNASRVNVHLFDETQGASSSTWIMGQEDISSSVALKIPGEYYVNLVASNAFGCQDVAVEKIQLGDRKEANAPAMFSPDGDGRYDTFMPLIVMDLQDDWNLTVWDGMEVVFETNDVRSPWDGSLQDGGLAVPGKSYVWKLQTTSTTGDRCLFVDNVLIDGE